MLVFWFVLVVAVVIVIVCCRKCVHEVENEDEENSGAGRAWP